MYAGFQLYLATLKKTKQKEGLEKQVVHVDSSKTTYTQGIYVYFMINHGKKLELIHKLDFSLHSMPREKEADDDLTHT